MCMNVRTVCVCQPLVMLGPTGQHFIQQVNTLDISYVLSCSSYAWHCCCTLSERTFVASMPVCTWCRLSHVRSLDLQRYMCSILEIAYICDVAPDLVTSQLAAASNDRAYELSEVAAYGNNGTVTTYTERSVRLRRLRY